jgi:hypothetical protein
MRALARLSLGLLGGLAACSPPSPHHDIAYYRDHPEVRAERVAVCRTDRSPAGPDRDCAPALTAERDASTKLFWSVHPPAGRVADPGKL